MSTVILTHEISGLGAAGDVVDVKPGYARNYLLPRGLATHWTKGAQNQIDQMRAARRAREIASADEAREVRDTLEAQPVVVAVRAGAAGRLFGSVTTAEIARSIREAGGPSIDRRRIEIARPIKALGDHRVTVRLHEDIEAIIDVQVIEA